MNLMTFVKTSNASQCVDTLQMPPDEKASFVEQSAHFLPNWHLIGPFPVIVCLLAILQISMA